MEMCRACLSSGINMIPMDESVIENFNDITNLNIKLSDHMLLYTCEECHNALIFCKQFREKCIASDYALNKILCPNDKIKLELNNEDNDYYVVINKDGPDDIKKDKITDDYYYSEIDETIIEPSTKIITNDFNDEDTQKCYLNGDTLCGLCSANFLNKDMLIEHLAIHIDDSNCQICLEAINSKSQLLAHRMQHIPDKQKGCLFCDKSFVNTASLEFHYMTIHKLDKKIFDEVKQDYYSRKIKVIGTLPIEENEVSSKGKNSARIKQIRQKKNHNGPKLKRKKILVDTNKIMLSESELKKLLEKPKEGFVPYYCGICPQELEEKRQLIRHLQYHKMDAYCSLCELEFNSYPHMLAHRLAHIPDNQNSCLFCPRKIFYESELEQHYLDMHNLTKKLNTQALPYFCTHCFCTYDTEKQMKQHMKHTHGDIKYVCDYCSKGFRVKGALVSHIASHQDNKHFKCSKCDYRAKFSGGIKEHMLRRHTKSRVYCRVCRRAFPTIEMLDRHRPCIVDADIMCPICGINLKMSSSLNRHLRTHTDVYTYKCGLCPAQYKSKSSFDAHMNKHNGTKKFECEYCPMKFYSQPVLIKHRRIHTGERPYACKLCDKTFTGNHNLKVHMRVHGFELINKRK